MKFICLIDRKTRNLAPIKQQGQSVIEFLVSASFILVPLMFLVTYLGKVGDTQHRAYEGSRYAAWESARTDKQVAAIHYEIDNRILRYPYTSIDSIKDGQRSSEINAAVAPIYFHMGNDGEYQALLEYSRGSITRGDTSEESAEAISYKTVVNLLKAGFAKINVNDAGLVTALVEIPLEKTRWLTDLGVNPRAWNTMLVDSWQAVTRDKVEQAIDEAILARHRFIDERAIEGASEIASMIGLEEWTALEPGYIEHDVVPCSRVIGESGDEDACR